jgi:hypothetical protein
MTTIKVTSVAAQDVHPNTLALAPARALKFLAASADPLIRKALAAVGWTDGRSEEGYELVNELKGVARTILPDNDPAQLAMARCEEIETTTLPSARAVLQMTLPEQASFMFGDFVPGKGATAVVNMMTFLERRHALENSPERKGTRKADHEALAVMTEVGVTKESVKEMQELIDQVKSAQVDDTIDDKAAAEQRIEVLQKIHAFVVGWSELARIVVTRRDQRIRLGIAKRRAKKGAAQPVDPAVPAPVVTTPVVTTPVVTAPVAVPAPSPAPSAPSAPLMAHEDSGPRSRAA